MQKNKFTNRKKKKNISNHNKYKDISPKKKFDKVIIETCIKINRFNDYYTTSSCSGRICIFKKVDNNKKGGNWLFINHKLSELKLIENILEKFSKKSFKEKQMEKLEIKFEPFILHLEIKNLESAWDFLIWFRNSGFREISTYYTSKRIILRITIKKRIEIPLLKKGQRKISRQFLKFIFQEVKSNFVLNHIKLQNFEVLIEFIRKKNKELRYLQREFEITHKIKSDCYSFLLISNKQKLKEVKKILREKKWLRKDEMIKMYKIIFSIFFIPVKFQCFNTIWEINQLIKCLIKKRENSFIYKLKRKSKEAFLKKYYILTNFLISALCLSTKKNFFLKLSFQNLKINHQLMKNLETEKKIVYKLFSKIFNINFFPTISERWDRLGFSLLFSISSFTGSEWHHLLYVWKVIKNLQKINIGKQKIINLNKYRNSQIRLLWGKEAWIEHIENMIIYNFDITRCMFSSGNGTEKYRISDLCKINEIFLDLYSGIGYFSIPYLKNDIIYLIAFEWNPYAFEALQINLKTNKIESKREILLHIFVLKYLFNQYKLFF